MNKTRRKQLEAVVEILTAQIAELESIKDDEQEAFDNLPEGFQCTERGETMGENIDELDTIIADLESVIESIDEIMEK
jgi:hypothetical protein